VPLDAENYYMDAVPILFDWANIAAFNMMAMLGILTVLWLPTYIVARISPVKAIKFS
jgi:lipoprotein-releasing system permease protein